ncbi:ABC transporter substrate-binding protein [Streptomyces sp. NPDC092296]|uniref:ABC transporter substrate-binding protein n=1 Tax=Streptomyces sp. NPDC092296 TaxID=3366012 RepID=UPI00381AE1D3
MKNLRWAGAAGVALAGLLASGCGVPGGGGAAVSAGITGPRITRPVTVQDVAALGPTTLRVLADSGEDATLKALVPMYEKKYPNVKVDVVTKGFDDLMKTVVNSMSGSDAPDLVQGNQGYGTDGPLVKAGLIRPLDDVMRAYGWENTFTDGALKQYRWTPDGAIFGSGSLYGISPATEYVGVFYNTDKLAALGLKPPTGYAEFTADLARAKAAGQQPIMMGNAEKYPASQIIGLVQAQNVPSRDVRSWISGVPGATISDDGTKAAARTVQDWAKQGWFGKGYDGISSDDAVAKFSHGQGVFLVAGSWNAPALQQSMNGRVGFTLPTRPDGTRATVGSLGLGWHINSRTKELPAATAFLGMLMSDGFAQTIADVGRTPVTGQGGVKAASPVVDQVNRIGLRLLADDGQNFYLDWASTTMLDTVGAKTQDLLAGRLSPGGFTDGLQSDWQAFQNQQREDAAAAGGTP